MTGADLVISILRQRGYSHIFGIPGRRLLPLFDSAYRDGGVKMIVTQHEQGAAYMADCYSRLTGMGCCVGISGPGALNLLNGVASAYADSIPLLVIGGQAKVQDFGRYAIQESTGIGRTPNQLKIFSTVTKFSKLVTDAEDLAPTLNTAIDTIFDGRKGPAYVEIPTNFLFDPIDTVPPKLKSSQKVGSRIPLVPDVGKCLEILAHSERPLLLVGNGVVLSDAEPQALALVESLGLPFATTLLAKGAIDEEHPLALGCVGIWGQKAANEYLLHRADTILAIGTSFQELSTLGWRSTAHKRLIRVDIDPSEIDRNCAPIVKIVADAREFIVQCLSEVSKQSLPLAEQFSLAHSEVAALKSTYGYYHTSKLAEYPASQSEKIMPYDALIAISLARSRQDIFVVDVGECGYFAEFLVQSHSRRTYLINAGLGSMGFAVAGAVGARAATPGPADVIAICGDGGFLMNVNELATAAKYDLKVIWCVMNNGILGTQKHYQRDFLEGRFIGSDVPEVDIANLSRALGVAAVRVETLDDLRRELSSAKERSTSTVIDIVIDDQIKPIPPFAF